MTADAIDAAPRIKTSALPQRRQAGVCLHLTSLPGDYGIGEIGASAHRFIDFMADAGLGVWQFLPTGPTAYGDSPYQPLSSFAGNPLLIDMAQLVADGLLEQGELDPLRALPRERVDYGELIPLKTRLLHLAAQRFATRAPEGTRARRAAFVAEHDARWLHDYAVYRILKSRHDEKSWTVWEPALAQRDSFALRQAEHTLAAGIETLKTIQFLFYDQWQALRAHARSRRVALFGDVPIYIALDSADAWSMPELLRLDDAGRPTKVAGVPPDYFSADGQLWGNPLYDWDRQAASGFDWWIARLRHAASMLDLIRIDHFRGLESYWSIPAEATTARDGAWEIGPGDAFFDAVRNALGPLPIVAEDLGAMTPAVDELRDRHHIPGMVVLQFDAAYEDFNAANIDAYKVCYTGTHDNDTTQGWFRGGVGDTRTGNAIQAAQRNVLMHTGGSAATVHLDLIRLAFDSPAQVAIAPLQDFLGLPSAARMNTPGSRRDNWRWRVREEQLDESFMREVRAQVAGSGRGPAGP